MTTLMPTLKFNTACNQPRQSLIDDFFAGWIYPTLFTEEKDWTPKIEVSEKEKEYLVKAELPGIEKENINIALTDGLLTIKGEKKKEKKEKDENYHRIETSYGSFSRTLRLPDEVDNEKIDATYKNGILAVRIPKTKPVEPKKIKIN
jgi:HSP20 family protein